MDVEEVADEEAYGADEGVAEAIDGVNFDGDPRGLAGEEVRGDSEEEAIVPGGVLAADSVNGGAKLDGGVDPSERIGLHPP